MQSDKIDYRLTTTEYVIQILGFAAYFVIVALAFAWMFIPYCYNLLFTHLNDKVLALDYTYKISTTVGQAITVIIASGAVYATLQSNALKRKEIEENKLKADNQFTLDEKKTNIERLSKALDLLRHTDEISQVGGVYALETIANNSSEDDYIIVFSILSNYLKERSHNREKGKEQEIDEAIIPMAVRAALLVISRRPFLPNDPLKRNKLDLWGSILLKAYVPPGSNMSHLNLREANLRFSRLENADLSNTNLRNTQLQFSNLRGVDFSKVSDLGGALLFGADMSDANFADVDLSKALFPNFSDSKYYGKREVELGWRQFEEPRKFNMTTNFSNARFHNTNINGLALGGCHGLTPEQVQGCFWIDKPPRLPGNIPTDLIDSIKRTS